MAKKPERSTSEKPGAGGGAGNAGAGKGAGAKAGAGNAGGAKPTAQATEAGDVSVVATAAEADQVVGGPTPGDSTSGATQTGTAEPGTAAATRGHYVNPLLPRTYRPAMEPRKAPRARGWTFVLGLVLIAAGAVGIRELLIETDVITGPRWVAPITDWFGRAHWENSFLVVAIIAIVLGAIIFIAALRPRARTHVSVDNQASLWMRPVDIARACSARARGQRGVLDARTVATRKRVSVTVTGDPDDPSLEQRIRDVCTPIVNLMEDKPELRIRLARPRSNQ